MKKFAFYTSVTLLTLACSFYVLFLVAKNQVVNTFGFIEQTPKQQYILRNFKLHNILFSERRGIAFVFTAERGIGFQGKIYFKERNNPTVYFSWSLLGKRLWYCPSEIGYVTASKSSWLFNVMIKQKIEAYKKHIARQNGDKS